MYCGMGLSRAHVIFVVDRVAMEKKYPPDFGFPTLLIILPLLRTHVITAPSFKFWLVCNASLGWLESKEISRIVSLTGNGIDLCILNSAYY
jgi:hypothetical protein